MCNHDFITCFNHKVCVFCGETVVIDTNELYFKEKQFYNKMADDYSEIWNNLKNYLLQYRLYYNENLSLFQTDNPDEESSFNQIFTQKIYRLSNLKLLILDFFENFYKIKINLPEQEKKNLDYIIKTIIYICELINQE